MNVRQIIDPLDLSHPCGKNVRENTSSREIYYRIKDARGTARAVERSINPANTIEISPSWHEVSNLGLQILSSESKDIEVLAWLAEAELRLRGFEGLGDVYESAASLLDNYFDSLHSIGDDDPDERFAPLAGLNGIGGEGAIIQPIRLVSLVPGGKFGQFSLWDFQLAQRGNEAERRDELQQAATQAGVAQMSAHLDVVNRCISAFERMTEILDSRCADQAPPSSNTRNALQEAAAAIRVLAGIEDTPEALSVPSVREENMGADLISSDHEPERPMRVTAETIRSREEAFELLAVVARYFRRAEPHSPISMSIETLVRRGRMDFSELLAELLPEQHVRNSVLTAAGIQPSAERGG